MQAVFLFFLITDWMINLRYIVLDASRVPYSRDNFPFGIWHPFSCFWGPSGTLVSSLLHLHWRRHLKSMGILPSPVLLVVQLVWVLLVLLLLFRLDEFPCCVDEFDGSSNDPLLTPSPSCLVIHLINPSPSTIFYLVKCYRSVKSYAFLDFIIFSVI